MKYLLLVFVVYLAYQFAKGRMKHDTTDLTISLYSYGLILICGISLFLAVGCGGDLPKNCGDNILQSDEICEMGSNIYCLELDYIGGMAYCDDCHGWDITDCTQRK